MISNQGTPAPRQAATAVRRHCNSMAMAMIGKTRHGEGSLSDPDRSVGPPRGVLRPAPGPGAFHHARIGPCETLHSLIEHFWIVRWDLRGHPPQIRETLPHPSVHAVIERGRTRIAGVHTGRFTRELSGHGGVFGIKFRPGGFRPFLQRSVATIAELELPFDAVFGSAGTALERDVLACGENDHAAVAIAERFLLEHLPPPDATVERVATLVAGIVDDRSITSVDVLVQRHAINKRALQRLFQEYVGVNPKWVINRYRMHEALEQLASGSPPDWAELALSLGYFDQAHFIRDFKQLIGRTPAEYVRESAPPRTSP